MEVAFDWVRHTLQLETLIHDLVLAVHQVDSAERSYLYTGRAAYLDAFYAAEVKIPADLVALNRAIVEDPEQQQRLMELDALVCNRLEFAREVVNLKRSGRHDAAVKISRSDSNKSAMESIDIVATQMRKHEDNLLGTRDRALMATRRDHARWLYALLALNISSLGSILLLLRRLDKAQSLARVCAWSKRIEHEGQWLSLEDYLSRRFSIRSTHTISPPELNRVIADSNQEECESASVNAAR
jgi:CHASE3 domain sensor protein